MFPGGLAASTMLMAATVLLPTGVAGADPPPPPLRHVQYTVFTEQPYHAEIYYRDTDPPSWAEYSHNPYFFSPNVEADVGPDQMWMMEVWLANPEMWAMVVASIPGESTAKPNFHCVLAVDGVVVKTHAGPKGALCSIRNW
jgi:hypothetical protein